MRDLAGFVQRAENRQAAMPEVIAAGAVVHESDHVVAELAVLENSIGDEPAELAGAGNQDPFEADAGPPPALERLAHQLTGRVGQEDVQREEQPPDDLRHLVGASILQLVGDVVRLDVQGSDDAEHDGEDAADKDGKKIVDARTPPPQAIQALHVECERYQHADERQNVDVLAEGRIPLRNRDQTAFEPDDVGQNERRNAQHCVGTDV